MGVIIGALLVVAVLVLAAPCLGIDEGGKIPFSRMQLTYGLLSVLIAVALYVWGVGDWSRFEPPRDSEGSGDKSSDAKATPQNPPGNTPQTPAIGTPAGDGPAAPKGGH